MKRAFTVAVAAFGLLGANTASAADLRMPVKAPPPVVAPLYSWTGCYVGIEGGGNWGRSQHYRNDPTENPALQGLPQTAGINLSGGLVGGTLGCNYEVNNFVFGIEGDASWTNKSGTANLIPPFRPEDSFTTSENWFGTVRGRVGYAWDRLLVYGTAGGAFTTEKINLCDPAFGCVSASKGLTGWTAGGGIEYAFWQNVSAKLEYLHAGFGRNSYGRLVPSPGFVFAARDVTLRDDIVRVGINWKFWAGQ